MRVLEYADGLCLLCPSFTGIKEMLNILVLHIPNDL